MTAAKQKALDALAHGRLDAVSRFPFLAHALFALTFVVQPNQGATSVDRHWRCYVDPEVGTWPHDEIVTALLHEVWHLLRDHHGRAEALHAPDRFLLWNIAADAEINDDLADDGVEVTGLVLPETFGLSPHGTAEMYYAALDPGTGPGPNCGSGAHGRFVEGEVGPSDAPAVMTWEAGAIRERVAEAIQSDAKASLGCRRWADATLKLAALPWQSILRRAIRRSTASAPGAVDYSWSRPNRRASVLGPVALPSLRRPTLEVAIVVDTSGSISQPALGQLLAEVAGILAACGYPRAPVICCESEAHPTQRVRTASALQVEGGGGTDMRSGILAAISLRPRPHIIVVLTDGFTPWPEHPPKRCTVIVCLTAGVNDTPPPWARTVKCNT